MDSPAPPSQQPHFPQRRGTTTLPGQSPMLSPLPQSSTGNNKSAGSLSPPSTTAGPPILTMPDASSSSASHPSSTTTAAPPATATGTAATMISVPMDSAESSIRDENGGSTAPTSAHHQTATTTTSSTSSASAAASAATASAAASTMSARLAASASHRVTPFVQLATQTLFRVTSYSRWLRRLSPVWSLLGSLLAAYLFPVVSSVSNQVILLVVAVLFFLVGLNVPIREWVNSVFPFRLAHIIVIFLTQFLAAPTVTVLVFFLFSPVHSGSASGLARAMACGAAACLPPSPSSTASLTAVAGGSDSLAFLSSTVVNTVGLILVPFLAQIVVSIASFEQFQTAPGRELGVHFREATQLISMILITTLIPLGLGCAVQIGIAAFYGSGNSSSSTGKAAANTPPQNSRSPAATLDTTTMSSSASAATATAIEMSPLVSSDENSNQNNSTTSTSSSSSSSICFNNEPSLFDSGEQEETFQLCGGFVVFSRSRVRKLIGLVSFVLRYLCFLSMFQAPLAATVSSRSGGQNHPQLQQQQSSSSSASPAAYTTFGDPLSLLSWGQLLRTFGLGLLIALLNTGVAWLISRVAVNVFATPSSTTSSTTASMQQPVTAAAAIHQHFIDDRIALFFASVQKADLLIAPLFSQLFVSLVEGRVVVIMGHAFLFTFAHIVVAALLAVGPLQEWRRRQMCRPGSNFLPSKLSRVPAHQAMLSPPSSGSIHFGFAQLSHLSPPALVKSAAAAIKKHSKSEASKA